MADATRPRLVSLDVLRGLTVVGMILVNSMAGMKYGAEATVYPLLLHAHWDGLMLADLVFPGFLMMVGVAVPLAMANAREGGQVRQILARTARLFVLGFLLSNLYWFADMSSGDWRLFGVLQRIALAYGACALLFLVCGPRARLAILVAILVLYWPLTLLPALDGLPTDIWARGHNFVASVDRLLLGAGNHMYVTGPEGYDPEGLLGTLPAIAHALIGVAIGEYLLRRPAGSARTLALAGAGMLAAGVAWGFVFPVIKDIWSSSFVLVTCGIATLALAGLHAWLDGPREQGAATRAFVLFGSAFGINAIAAYVLHQLSAPMPTWQIVLVPFQALRGALGDGLAAFVPVLLYIAFLWLCMEYLRRRKWVIKILRRPEMKFLILAAFAAFGLAGADAPPAPQAADNLLNAPSANWNVYGAAQTHKGVRDKQVQGGGAMRVTIAAKPANAWDAGASNPIAKPIRKGDKLMLAVWARLVSGGANGITEIAAAIQRSAAPYEPIVSGRLTLTKEWKLVHIQGIADADFAAGAANIALSLGTDAHVVDLGPAFVLLVS